MTDDPAIESAKGKMYKNMSNPEKIAFVEYVCMTVCEYVHKTSSNPHSKSFFKYWSDEVLNMEKLSTSKWMDRYLYTWDSSKIPRIYVVDDAGNEIDLSHNLKELKLFVYNAVNPVPFHSPLVAMLNDGYTQERILDEGISTSKYLSISRLDLTKRPQKDSLRQKVLRGEITHYEAYQKVKKTKGA